MSFYPKQTMHRIAQPISDCSDDRLCIRTTRSGSSRAVTLFSARWSRLPLHRGVSLISARIRAHRNSWRECARLFALEAISAAQGRTAPAAGKLRQAPGHFVVRDLLLIAVPDPDLRAIRLPAPSRPEEISRTERSVASGDSAAYPN